MMIRRDSKAVRLLTMTLAGAVLHLASSGCFLGLRLAHAQQSGDRQVGLFVLPKAAGDEQEAVVLQSILRAQVDKLRGIELARTAPIKNRDNVVRAAQLAEEGNKALLQSNAADALTRFQGAWDLLEQAPGAADDRLLAMVMKGLGVATAMSGQMQDAYRYVRRSVLLWDNQSAAEYGYTLETRNLFDRVLADISTDPSGTLAVESVPAGGEVHLGGQLRGYTPITVGSLTAGEQYVEVAKDGFYRYADFVDVPVGAQGLATTVLEPIPSKDAIAMALTGTAKSFQASKVNAPLMQLKQSLGADELLVLRANLEGGSFNVDGFYMTKDGAVQPVNVQVARDASLLENLKLFLSTQLASSYEPDVVRGPLSAPTGNEVATGAPGAGDENLILDPNAPIFKKTGDDDEDGITKQWWFWTLIGVGVAGAATAIVLPLTLGGDDSGGAGPTGSLSVDFGNY
jgi:hypothetical protein